jgi:predicted NBD/HSP70 family sugar kinase
MLKISKFTQEQISEINKAQIISLIKRNREITKLELATELELSHTTVNTYVRILIEEGIVEHAGVAASSGGRKPKILRIIPEARYSFGVSISTEIVSVVLVNLLGEEIVRESFSYSKGECLDSVIERLKEYINNIIQVNCLNRDRILGIGIVLPGVVNEDKNLLEYSAKLNVKNYSFEEFQKSMSLEIYLENEANAAAYAEQLLGRTKENQNFVYVSIAEGIGTGIIIDKYIYKGCGKKAGEFGHMKVSHKDLKCNCGRTGCWELFASKDALLNYCNEHKKQKGYSIDHLFYDYMNGDVDAIRILEKYTIYLFKGIENILISINPDYVIIGGDLSKYADEIIKIGIEKLGITKKFFGYEDIKIFSSGLKDNGAVIGAALLPLEKIFNYQKNVI